MKALILQSDKTAEVERVSVPEIDDNEVLVEVVAVAQNPGDWKCACSHFPGFVALPNLAEQTSKTSVMRVQFAESTGPVTL